ncbi:MAG: phosphotransferase family protein [Chitinophagaceae bacterium]
MPKHSATQVRQKTEMVKKLIKHHFGRQPKKIEFQPAGLTNFVFDVTCKGEKFIVRIARANNKINDYIKEQWAVERAREKGVPVAEILEVGNEVIGVPYMLQRKLEGSEALNHPDRLNILCELGRYARIIHAIPTSNYGNVFDWSKKRLSKKTTWKSYLQEEMKLDYRLQVLKKHSILNKGQYNKLVAVAERMIKRNVTPSLNHGDLRLKNVIVNEKGEILAIIDWENCTSHVAPYWDFSIALHDLSIDGRQEFLKGYGLNPKDYSVIAQAIKAFNVLNYTGTIERIIQKKDVQRLEFYQLRLNGYLDMFAF